jgi:hypothetical protein
MFGKNFCGVSVSEYKLMRFGEKGLYWQIPALKEKIIVDLRK